MNLATARSLRKQLHKSGILAEIVDPWSGGKQACEQHTPGLHPMAGRYAVRECGVAKQQQEARWFWPGGGK